MCMRVRSRDWNDAMMDSSLSGGAPALHAENPRFNSWHLQVASRREEFSLSGALDSYCQSEVGVLS